MRFSIISRTVVIFSVTANLRYLNPITGFLLYSSTLPKSRGVSRLGWTKARPDSFTFSSEKSRACFPFLFDLSFGVFVCCFLSLDLR